MKKTLIPVLILSFLPFAVSCQEVSLLDIFITNFDKGSPDVKYQVLLDSVNLGIEGMGPLFHKAIRYVLNQIESIDTEEIYSTIALYSIQQIQRIQYIDATEDIWTLFIRIDETELRVKILIALGNLVHDNASIIKKMNAWLDSQNDIFLTGKNMDLQVITACVQTLGKIGDSSSFVPLYTTMILQYSALISNTAEQALNMIKGDTAKLYMDVLREGRYPEKKTALEKIIKSTGLTDQDKTKIVLFALNIALNSAPINQDDRILALEMRYIAVEYLSKKEWSPATDLMIENFNQAIDDLDNGRVTKSFLLQAITALGNMKTHEAAKRLTLYLDLINSYTENGKVFDEQIVLAVTYALGNIGDRIASAALLYTRYLNYSRMVKKAAQDALQDLQ